MQTTPTLVLPPYESLGLVSDEVIAGFDQLVDDFGKPVQGGTGKAITFGGSNGRTYTRYSPPIRQGRYMPPTAPATPLEVYYEKVEPTIAPFERSAARSDEFRYWRQVLQPREYQGVPGWHFDMFGCFLSITFVGIDKPDCDHLTTCTAVGQLADTEAEVMQKAKQIDRANYEALQHCPYIDRHTWALLGAGRLALRVPVARSGELQLGGGRQLHRTEANRTDGPVTRRFFRHIRYLTYAGFLAFEEEYATAA